MNLLLILPFKRERMLLCSNEDYLELRSCTAKEGKAEF